MDKVIEREESREEKAPPQAQEEASYRKGGVLIIKPKEQDFSAFAIRDIQITCRHQCSPEHEEASKRPKTVSSKRGHPKSFL